MNEINEKCLELFPKWLQSLGEDVAIIVEALKMDSLDTDIRKTLAGGLNYLFKSLDLIPDGIDDIGYLDDAFILRLTARGALESDNGKIPGETREKLARLAGDTETIGEFLGDDIYTRLHKYALKLSNGAARGRTVNEIVEDTNIFREFATETRTFTEDYSSPGFSKDEKNLIKLKAFFDAKLPK